MIASLTIIGMAIITVLIKATIFILGERLAFAPVVRQALDFVPVTVLTAIIVPLVLAPHGAGLEFSWHNPQLVAALAAILVCAITRHQLLTIGLGLGVFFGWQFWLA